MKSKYSTTLCLLCGAYIAKGGEIRSVGGARVHGLEDCAVCLGEGRVPVFQDRDGLRAPIGYRPCDCVAEG